MQPNNPVNPEMFDLEGWEEIYNGKGKQSLFKYCETFITKWNCEIERLVSEPSMDNSIRQTVLSAQRKVLKDLLAHVERKARERVTRELQRQAATAPK
jgi:hypothetical protein